MKSSIYYRAHGLPVCNILITLLAVAVTIVCSLPAEASYLSTIAADHPLAWYQFNDSSTTNGSTTADSSGHVHNGTYTNGVTDISLAASSVPALGTAAQFTGVGNVSLPTGFLPAGSSPRTIEGWFNTGESGNTQDVFNEGLNNLPSLRTTLTANRTEVSVAVGGGQWGVSNLNLAANSWHYFAFVFPSGSTTVSQFQVYLDGALLPSTLQAGNNVAVNTTDAQNYIGTDGGSPPVNFTGDLAQVAIYDTALSAGQILAHYEAGVFVAPEPSTWLLMALGALGCAVLTRKQKNLRPVTLDRCEGLLLVAVAALACCRPAVAGPVAGAAFWLDASDSSTLTVGTGNKVSAWNDKGSIGDNLSASGTAQPTLIANAVNGLPVVNFNGLTNVMTNATLAPFNNGDQYTTFVVFSGPTIVSAQEEGILDTASSGPGRHLIYINSNGANIFQGGGGGNVANGNYVGGQLSVMTAVWNGGVTNGSSILINGAQQTTGTLGLDTTAPPETSLGQELLVPTGYLAGNVAEILIYNSVLSPSQILQNDLYLEGKWGTPEPSSWLLMAVGTVGCGLMVRRRKATR